jgi:hypothetical protein
MLQQASPALGTGVGDVHALAQNGVPSSIPDPYLQFSRI